MYSTSCRRKETDRPEFDLEQEVRQQYVSCAHEDMRTLGNGVYSVIKCMPDLTLFPTDDEVVGSTGRSSTCAQQPSPHDTDVVIPPMETLSGKYCCQRDWDARDCIHESHNNALIVVRQENMLRAIRDRLDLGLWRWLGLWAYHIVSQSLP
eukprot:GHVO01005907.1.p1 GENE.GHVO01005907.1~~GHVO01005907.1.p1  ORF type:complete len:151 (+),score=8.31 GHVO01005907.1:10-462(+)